MGKLDTAYGSFSELIQAGKTYEVPRYQRRYSWRPKREVRQLWTDIWQLYLAVQRGETVDGHFIGPVVLGASPARALGSVPYPVIDGQQRLITLSLVVAALRDALVEDRDQWEQITETYLGKKDDLRVLPGEKDRVVFEQIALGGKVSDKKSLVFLAYEQLKDEMLSKGAPHTATDVASPRSDEIVPLDDEAGVEETEDLQTEDSPDDQQGLEDSAEYEAAQAEEEEDQEEDEPVLEWEPLLDVVGTQLFLVSISGVPTENAYQIFASLNHKGLQLGQVDLIRNAVFMLLPEESEAVDAYSKVWQPLEKAMDDRALSRYLHTWVMRRGRNIPAKDTYRGFLGELSAPNMKAADIRSILDELFVDAWAYLLITAPFDDDRRRPFDRTKVPDSIKTALSRLQQWGSVPMEPLLMEIVGRWLAKRLSTKKTVATLGFLESFVVRRFIVRVPPNDLRSSFGRLVRQVKDVEDDLFADMVKAALCEDTRRWPKDGELLEAMKTEPLYRDSGNSQTFLVLKFLAEAMQQKECPEIKHGRGANDYSIEHILPQGTGSGLPPSWQSDMRSWGDPDPLQTWTTRLHVSGNLTLTAYNSELGNRSFAEKKKWIKDKLYLQLSRGILNFDTWTATQIDERSQALAAVAQKLWPRPK